MDVTIIGRVVAATERTWDQKTDAATGEVKTKAGSFYAVYVVSRFESAPVEVRVLDEALWRRIHSAGPASSCRIEAELRTFTSVGERTARESLTLIGYTPLTEAAPNGPKAPAPAPARV